MNENYVFGQYIGEIEKKSIWREIVTTICGGAVMYFFMLCIYALTVLING